MPQLLSVSRWPLDPFAAPKAVPWLASDLHNVAPVMSAGGELFGGIGP
jgi:hypothetical protein